MKKIVGIVTSILIASSMVHAEENGTSWEGPYAGISIGGLQGTATATEYSGPWDYGEYSITDLGYTAGILAGYNWLIGASGVAGLEADINWVEFNPDRSFSGGSYKNEADWSWFSTVRARSGVAINDALIFIAAGVAIVDVEYSFGSVSSPVSEDNVTVGYTTGAGVEFAVSESVKVRGEYLYIGLPSEEVNNFGGDTGDFVSSANIVRIGAIMDF